MADYSRYKTDTLKKMLSRAEEKYRAELEKEAKSWEWGQGMRHSRLSQGVATSRAYERVCGIKVEIEKRQSLIREEVRRLKPGDVVLYHGEFQEIKEVKEDKDGCRYNIVLSCGDTMYLPGNDEVFMRYCRDK